ncbi:hypothetical protein KCU64_g28, partial [Aureobasidium melanogenum]
MASKKRKRACATGKQSGGGRATKKKKKNDDKDFVQTPTAKSSSTNAGAPTTGPAVTEAVAQTQCRILLLPAELRKMIYGYVFDTGTVDKKTLARVYTIGERRQQRLQNLAARENNFKLSASPSSIPRSFTDSLRLSQLQVSCAAVTWAPLTLKVQVMIKSTQNEPAWSSYGFDIVLRSMNQLIFTDEPRSLGLTFVDEDNADGTPSPACERAQSRLAMTEDKHFDMSRPQSEVLRYISSLSSSGRSTFEMTRNIAWAGLLYHTNVLRQRSRTARAAIQKAKARKQTETHDHADEHGSSDARVHCCQKDYACEGNEGGEGEHVLEAAKQVSESLRRVELGVSERTWWSRITCVAFKTTIRTRKKLHTTTNLQRKRSIFKGEMRARPPHRIIAASRTYHLYKIYLSDEMRDRYTLQWERGGSTARHAVLTVIATRRSVPARPTRRTERSQTYRRNPPALAHVPHPHRK